MDQNPYAAPRTTAELGTGGSATEGSGPQPWEIGEVLSQSWEVFKANWGIVVGTFIVGYLAIFLVQQVVGAALGVSAFRPNPQPGYGKLFGAFAVQIVLGQLVTAFIQVGWIRVWLGAVRGEQPTFGTFLSGGSRYIPMLLSTLLLWVAMALGFVLLIVPGIILGLGLFFTPYFVADSELGVVDALKASWQATDGHKASLFVFGIVLFFLNLLGAIPCGLGLFVTGPMSVLSFAIVYTRITGRTRSSTADGSLPGLS